MRRLIVSLLALSLALASAAHAQAPAGWETYRNVLYRFSVAVPPEFLLTEEAGNGEGITLATADGAVDVNVFGMRLATADYPGAVLARIAEARTDDGWKITEQQVGKTGGHYVGVLGARLLSVETIALCRQAMALVEVEYPQADKARYEPIIAQMTKTLAANEECKP